MKLCYGRKNFLVEKNFFWLGKKIWPKKISLGRKKNSSGLLVENFGQKIFFGRKIGCFESKTNQTGLVGIIYLM